MRYLKTILILVIIITVLALALGLGFFIMVGLAIAYPIAKFLYNKKTFHKTSHSDNQEHSAHEEQVIDAEFEIISPPQDKDK